MADIIANHNNTDHSSVLRQIAIADHIANDKMNDSSVKTQTLMINNI